MIQPPKSLVSRLIGGFLVAGLLPLTLLGYFSLQQSESQLQQSILQHLSAIAEKKQLQIRIFLHERSNDAILLNRQISDQPSLLALEQALNQYGPKSLQFKRASRPLRETLQLYVGNSDNAHFHNILLINLDEHIIFNQRHPNQVGQQLQNASHNNLRQAFRISRHTLSPHISDLTPNPQRLNSYITLPLLDHGKLIGVAAYQLSSHRIMQIINDNIGLGNTGETPLAMLHEANSVLFVAPLRHDPQAAMQRIVHQQTLAVPMQYALKAEQGSGIALDYAAIPVIAAWRYLPETRLGMVVKMHISEAFIPIQQQKQQVFITLLLTATLGCLLVWLLGHSQVQRLRRLAEQADQIANGKLQQYIQDNDNDEISRLITSFNHMSAQLQEVHQQQQNIITQQTDELQQSNKQLNQMIAHYQQTSQQLQQQQALLSEAQQLGNIGCWKLDHHTNHLECSAELLSILNLSPGSRPDFTTLTSRIHPQDRTRIIQAYRRSQISGQPLEIKYRLQLAGNIVKWIHSQCITHLDKRQQAIYSIGAIQDITRQHQSAELLRIAAVTFETHEGILITDNQANIIRANQSLLHTFGYELYELQGQNPRIFRSNRQDSSFYHAMWQSLLQQGEWRGEIWNARKNKQVFPCSLVITAVRNEQQQVSEYVAIYRDISQQKQQEAEIYNLAFFDSLTGLPNRRLLLDRLKMAVKASERNHQYGALLFLDMDNFKRLNDSLGHEYGDILLQQVAQRLKNQVRTSDTVARFGGDEFVVLIERCGHEIEQASHQVSLVAEKIRHELARPYQLDQQCHHSSPSIGACLFYDRQQSPESILKYADTAMYQSKQSGRNQIHFFDPQMQQRLELRARLDADLHQAIAKQQLQYLYQPLTNLDNQIIAYELLIRWQHPQLGLLAPEQFLDIAKENGLIIMIGQQVIQRACQQLACWQHNPATRHLYLSINICAKELCNDQFIHNIEQQLRQQQINPALLVLELAETTLLYDMTHMIKTMQQLKQLGITLSLDNFGRGYASLSCLKELPIDQLKIDRCFVQDINHNPQNSRMIRAILQLAASLKIHIVAEGVENQAQYQYLRQHGCETFQGYRLGKPIRVATVSEQLPTA